jgi:hypothetical protein
VGEFSSHAHRLGVLGLMLAVHTVPAGASRRALADDFAVPHWDELEAACDPTTVARDCRPCARPVARMVWRHAVAIIVALSEYICEAC